MFHSFSLVLWLLATSLGLEPATLAPWEDLPPDEVISKILTTVEPQLAPWEDVPPDEVMQPPASTPAPLAPWEDVPPDEVSQSAGTSLEVSLQ